MAKRTRRSDPTRPADPDNAAPSAETPAPAGSKRGTSRPDATARADAAGAPAAASASFTARRQPVAGPAAARPNRAAESTSMASEPSEEDIRMRAYHLYLERGAGHGRDFDDWLSAERELRARGPED